MAGEINNQSLKANTLPTGASNIDLVTADRYIITSFAKDVYLLILRGLFGQNAGVFEYNDDPESTRLYIADRFEIPKEVQTFKPTIYLTRGRMGFSNLSIDNLMAMNLNTGASSHSDLIRGSMIINCVSEEGLEAEHLASLVFVLLAGFKQKFLDMKFHHFSVGEVLEERPLKADVDTKLVEVPVTTSFAFAYSWAISVMNSTPLADIRMSRARPVDPEQPICSSTVDACGVNIGIDGSGKDCGPFVNLAIEGETEYTPPSGSNSDG
jgi:hypothetical protein